MATAQADFRANDRDGNQVQDFWIGDIAGLYALKGEDGEPIRLVSIGIAAADAHPVTDIHLYTESAPISGYRYRSIRPAGVMGDRAPTRFAACSYPADYGATGTYTYIINEGNTIFKKDLGRGGGVQEYPADPLAEGWTALD